MVSFIFFTNFAVVNELERHIEILLLSNDCVIVPDFGGFMAHHVDARYDGRDNMFLPPLRTVGFNPQLKMNDSLLAQSYVEAYDISYPEAIDRLANEVAEIRQRLENEGKYEINNIGTIYLNEDGNYTFEPCEAGILTDFGHQTIYVITPEYTTGSQIILRDNLAPMVKGKHVLILAASLTTGYTVQAAVEAVNYYGGMVAGLSAIFATTHECLGIPVTSIFDPSSLPDYASFDSRDCPMCKAGQHIDALVNSFGYSAL